MLIPKKDRIAVYSHLFKEGVMVAKKDYNAPRHHELEVKNLYVIKLLQSLTSRGYVTENFNWQWYYWYLTNEGIQFLRGELNLPEEIIPATLKKPRPSANQMGRGERGDRRPGMGRGGERRFDDQKKQGAPGGDFVPQFRGGFGRGAPPQRN